ncbi:MAG: GldG family protein [Ruminococcus flavefaciens]|nr:GldG family protein [Ruminococcus flavefaciens]MCM1058899.1 GldG family protein [Eubacterium sp.]
MQKRKHNLSGPIAIAVALIILLIFVPVNLIVVYYDKVYDMTPAGKYTLNQKTAELLDSTSDKEIEVYFTSQLRYLQQVPRYLPLYHTLTQLNERDNIELICFDPNSDPTIANTLDPTGVLGVNVGDVFVKSGDVVKKVSQSLIFQQIDGIDQYAGEDLIAGAIKICTSGSLPTVYFLTGHGEKSIEDSYKIFADQLKSQNYDVKELNLDEVSAMPENAKIIYLAGPQSDLTEHEAELLDAYLENGGSASFLLAPCETEGRFLNIESILDKFGILIDYNYVTETLAVNKLQNREAEQSDNFMRIQYVPTTDDFTENLTGDVIYLVENEGYAAGIANARSLAEIPEGSFANAGNVEISPLIENTPSSTDGTYSTVSRSMGGDDTTSLEADNELSGIELAFGYYSYNKLTGGKVIAIGSTAMIDSDEVAPSINGTGMLTLFSNTWLHSIEDEIGIGNKIDAVDSMNFKDANEATTAIALTVIIPLVVAVIGVAVWLKRRHA